MQFRVSTRHGHEGHWELVSRPISRICTVVGGNSKVYFKNKVEKLVFLKWTRVLGNPVTKFHNFFLNPMTRATDKPYFSLIGVTSQFISKLKKPHILFPRPNSIKRQRHTRTQKIDLWAKLPKNHRHFLTFLHFWNISAQKRWDN